MSILNLEIIIYTCVDAAYKVFIVFLLCILTKSVTFIQFDIIFTEMNETTTNGTFVPAIVPPAGGGAASTDESGSSSTTISEYTTYTNNNFLLGT